MIPAPAAGLVMDHRLVYTVNRPVPEVRLFVGRVSRHELVFRNGRIPLADLAEPGTSPAIRPDRYSCYRSWKEVCLR
ncbi:MAG: hypothetical protein AB1641_06395 [Thermodesulfobacteriota bacterium]